MVISGVTQSLYKVIVFSIYSQCEVISNTPLSFWTWKCGYNERPLRDHDIIECDILKESHMAEFRNLWKLAHIGWNVQNRGQRCR